MDSSMTYYENYALKSWLKMAKGWVDLLEVSGLNPNGEKMKKKKNKPIREKKTPKLHNWFLMLIPISKE